MCGIEIRGGGRRDESFSPPPGFRRLLQVHAEAMLCAHVSGPALPVPGGIVFDLEWHRHHQSACFLRNVGIS